MLAIIISQTKDYLRSCYFSPYFHSKVNPVCLTLPGPQVFLSQEKGQKRGQLNDSSDSGTSKYTNYLPSKSSLVKLYRSSQLLGVKQITARNKVLQTTSDGEHPAELRASPDFSEMLMKVCLHLEVTADGRTSDSGKRPRQCNLIPDDAGFRAALAGPVTRTSVYSKLLYNHRPRAPKSPLLHRKQCSRSTPLSTGSKTTSRRIKEFCWIQRKHVK